MGVLSKLPELLPIVVLMHDAWRTPVHYSTVIDALITLGYAVACPQLPTADTESSSTLSFNDDCSLAYQLVFDLCSDGNDVLVIGHGYGAFVATEVLGDLTKQKREQLDRPGGVIGLVALVGLLPDQGESFKDVFTYHSYGEWPEYIREQKDTTLTLLQPGTFLYNDLGAMDREHWAAHLVRFTAKTSDIICTATPAWKMLPTTYIICEDDQYMTQELQRDLAAKTRAHVVEMEDVGHDPFIGKCEDLVNVIGAVVARLYMSGACEEPFVDAEEGVVCYGQDDSGSGASNAGSAHSAPDETQSMGEEEVDEMNKRPLRRSTTAPS